MDLDNEIKNWIQSLGLSIFTPPQAKEFFHISVTPPQGGPVVDIVRPLENSNFYIIAMGVGVHPTHQNALKELKDSDRKKFINEIKYDILKMGLDVIFLPMGQEVPQIIQITRVVIAENLTANEFMNSFYFVRNAGMLVIFKFTDTFGNIQQGQTSTKYL